MGALRYLLVTRRNLISAASRQITVIQSLLVTAGDNPERISTEAQFAHRCGAAPIRASSGKTRRHRLNRGGDRRANNSLRRIALVRLRYDRRTRAYARRRSNENHSKKDILPYLKRAIAREIHHVLTEPTTTRPDLRAIRQARGLALTGAATALGTWPARISDIERHTSHYPTSPTATKPGSTPLDTQ